MISENLSAAQSLSFGGLLLGFILCLGGVIMSDKWFYGELEVEDKNHFSDYVRHTCRMRRPFDEENIGWCRMSIGLWSKCCQIKDDYGCKDFNPDWIRDDKSFLVRIFCVINLGLALLCVTAPATCGCLCYGHTLFNGIVAFISGILGLAAVALFMTTDEREQHLYDYDIWFENGHYGRAMFLYIGGSVLITCVSLHLCLLDPMVKLPKTTILPKLIKMPNLTTLRKLPELPKLPKMPKLPFIVNISWREDRYATVDEDPIIVTTDESGCSDYSQTETPPTALPPVV